MTVFRMMMHHLNINSLLIGAQVKWLHLGFGHSKLIQPFSFEVHCIHQSQSCQRSQRACNQKVPWLIIGILLVTFKS